MARVYVLLHLLLVGLHCTPSVTCVHSCAFLFRPLRSSRLVRASPLQQQPLSSLKPKHTVNPKASSFPLVPHWTIGLTRAQGAIEGSSWSLGFLGPQGDLWSPPSDLAPEKPDPPASLTLGGGEPRWALPLQRQRSLPPSRLQGMPALTMVSVRRYRVVKSPWPLTVATASSAIVRRNNKKRQLGEDYAPLRRRYLHNIRESKTLDERMHWQVLLQQLPRDSSPTRYRRRCLVTGRARGVYRHFGLCRHKIKEMIDNLEIPGWTKAEW